MISLELQQFLIHHQEDDLDQLAFHAAKYPGVDIPFVLQQLKGRRIALQKIPTWASCPQVVFPRQISMEQSSSELTAKFKASLCKGQILLDLTGGLGVDFYFMAQNFSRAIYVEQQSELQQIAEHNFEVMGLDHAETICQDGVDYLQDLAFQVDTIFIDPARRSHSGQRTVLLQDCTPDLIHIDHLLTDKSAETLIKLSPMLDIASTISALNKVSDVYVLAVQNEVKELLLRKTQNQPPRQCIHALNFLKNGSEHHFSFQLVEESTAIAPLADSLKKYLYEPNAALLKAGAYKIVAERFSFEKLHANSHLYTSNDHLFGFPGRVFEVLDTFSFAKSELKRLHGLVSKANISVRNFPLDVDSLRKKLKLGDGGEYYLFATTLKENQRVLVLSRKAE